MQVQTTSGLPVLTVVGLPDKAVAESRKRVRRALQAMGLALPSKRITVNPSPADITKEGSHLGLPITLGLLAAMELLSADEVVAYSALGELALDGAFTQVAGVLPAAIHTSAYDRGLICPTAQGAEAALASEIEVLAPVSLPALITPFKGTQMLSAPEPCLSNVRPLYLDIADIKGEETAKRVLLVNFNIL